MTAPASHTAPERVRMPRAMSITGKEARALRSMAKGIPGAIKIGGEWTFDEAKLRAWLADLEKQQAVSCANPGDRNHRPTASGKVTSYGGGRRSPGKSGDGRYERMMSKLLRNGSKQTASAR